MVADTVVLHGEKLLLYHDPSAAALAGEFARFVSAMPAFPGLRVSLDTSVIRIFLAANEHAFTALTGGAAPHWGAGIALPDSGIIVLPAYTSRRAGVQDLGPVLRHELAHVELQRALGASRIPRWFTEGYAVWSAGQLDPDEDWYLRLAFITRRAPPLDSLELGWPAREADARVAYLLSASAVSYLYSLGSDEMFTAFIDGWRSTGSFEQSMRRNYLISSAQFERLWTRHVKRRYGWLLFLAQGAVVWTFFGVIAVVLIGVRRRRDRRRIAELRRTEIPDAPAFWLEAEPEVADDAEDPDPPPAG